MLLFLNLGITFISSVMIIHESEPFAYASSPRISVPLTEIKPKTQ